MAGVASRRLVVTSVLVALIAATACAAAPSEGRVRLGKVRPVLAVWEQHQGFGYTPHLRVAIWSDGRVLFAQDANGWNDALREGHIPVERVAALKRQLEATGVFKLTEPRFNGVPDGPLAHILVEFGARRTLLAWDEVESASYGDNIRPTAGYLQMKACWKALNRLAVAACPKSSRPVRASFEAPRFWWDWRNER